MPRPEPPAGWEAHLSETKLRYYFYNPADGASVWPPNLEKHLRQQSAGQRVASSAEHTEYLRSLDEALASTIQAKRDYFFSGLDAATRESIMLDEEASYSVTEQGLAERSSVIIKEVVAKAERARGNAAASAPAQVAEWSITDGTACVGGNTINFAKHFRAVHAVEIDPRRCEFLRHNVERVLGPRHNVRCHCGDFTAELGRQLEQDIVFFDPPWGGLGYKKQAVVPLFLSGINLSKICCDLQGRAAYIVLKVPINFDFVNFTAETSRTLEQLFLQEMFAEYNQRRAKFTLVVLRFRAPPAAKRKQPSASAAVADAGGGGTKRPKPDDDPTAHNAERYDIKTKQARGGKTDREVLRERVSDPTYPLKRYHNTVKRELINRFALRAAHVLDIASGRGGDLSKWVDAGVLRVTGLDVAASEVAEATERYNGMVQKGTNWSEQRARHGGAAAAQALVAEYREYAKVGKEELPLKDGVFDAITIMFAFHYFFQNMKTLDQVLADVGRCLRPGGYFFGTMPDGQRVLELLDGRPEFTNSFLKLAQRWEGVRKPIGSLYAFGIKNTVTEDVGEAENLEYLAMLDSFLPAMAKRHGLHVVTELQAPGLEALLDEQDVASAAPFKHFAPSRAQPAWSRQGAGQPHIADVDLQKASWVNCCFVFQKR